MKLSRKPLDAETSIRFTYFFIEICKKLLISWIEAFLEIISKLINSLATKSSKYRDHIEQGINQYLHFLPTLATKILASINSMTDTIDLQTIDVHTLEKIIGLYEDFGSFPHNRILVKDSLVKSVSSISSEYRKEFENIILKNVDNIRWEDFNTRVREREKSLFLKFYKEKVTFLKKSFENEDWTITKIPYSYSSVFEILLNTNLNNNIATRVNDLTSFDDILNSSRLETSNLDIIQKLAFEEEGNADIILEPSYSADATKGLFSLQKNQIFINGKSYKTTLSTLTMIQLYSDHICLLLNCKSIAQDVVYNVLNLLKFYNVMCRKFILEAEAIKYGKIQKITAKTMSIILIIGFSKLLGALIMSLKLVHKLTEATTEQIKSLKNVDTTSIFSDLHSIREDLCLHFNELIQKIRKVFHSKLVEQCKDLSNNNWKAEKMVLPTKQTATILHSFRQLLHLVEGVLGVEETIQLFNDIFQDMIENYLTIFQNIGLDSPILVSRLKEEIQYLLDDIMQLKMFESHSLNYDKFIKMLKEIIIQLCEYENAIK